VDKPEARAVREPITLGRYELITMIGKGGMAEVHLATQRGPGGFEKLVVIKLIHDHLATHRAFVDMLLDEGRLAGMIKHPNVVDIYDLGEADGRYFVAMEYLEGEPLLAVLRAGGDGKRLDPLSTARVIADTAEGLEAAHRLKSRDGKPLGLVHHDVSLGNVVVLYTGQVKLVDFGVAKASRSPDARDKVQGKFSYMAPEKLQDGEVDRRSDIWSLGVVMWEALTLDRLFRGDTDIETVRQVLESTIDPPSTVNPDVPKDLDPIVMRALERDASKRYSTAKAMALDIEEVLRKRGYGGKNERIAKYMQATFKDHIAARERLLADVSAGGASADVLEAAFRESATIAEKTITSTGEGPMTRPSSRDLAAVDGVPKRRGDPSWSGSHKAQSIRGLQKWVQENRAKPRPAWRKALPYAIGAAAFLVFIIVMASRGGNHNPASAASPPVITPLPTITPPAPKPTPPTPAPTPPPTVAANGSGAASGSGDLAPGSAAASSASVSAMGSGSASDSGLTPVSPSAETGTDTETGGSAAEIEMDPVTATHAPKKRRGPSAIKPDLLQPSASAESLYTAGLDAFRRGEPKSALASFTSATKANPNYAAAWYGLGLVNESLGNTGAARAAFLRYLSLAPRAANAQQIRERLERL
jgi:serine/threonine-protein kinase